MPRLINLDRYLKRRGQSWFYHRRVPTGLLDQDSRAPVVRQALGTRDLAAARRARDLLEAADDERWSAMMAGKRTALSDDRHASAVRMALALGFGYVPAADLAETANWPDLAERFEAVMPTQLSDSRKPPAQSSVMHWKSTAPKSTARSSPRNLSGSCKSGASYLSAPSALSPNSLAIKN